MALRVANELEISGPLIACSGAQVHLADDDRDIFDERMPEDFVADLYKLCDGERCVATVTVGDRVLLKLDGEPDRAALLPEMQWVKQLTGAADSLPRVAAIQGSRVNARIRCGTRTALQGSHPFFRLDRSERQSDPDDHRGDREQRLGARSGLSLPRDTHLQKSSRSAMPKTTSRCSAWRVRRSRWVRRCPR